MAYANHTNDMVNPNNDLLPILGSFVESTFNNTFEFAQRDRDHTNGFASIEEYPHVIYVMSFKDQQTRYANVKKTIAYVVVDEDAEGNPVVRKWNIKKYRKYAV